MTSAKDKRMIAACRSIAHRVVLYGHPEAIFNYSDHSDRQPPFNNHGMLRGFLLRGIVFPASGSISGGCSTDVSLEAILRRATVRTDGDVQTDNGADICITHETAYSSAGDVLGRHPIRYVRETRYHAGPWDKAILALEKETAAIEKTAEANKARAEAEKEKARASEAAEKVRSWGRRHAR